MKNCLILFVFLVGCADLDSQELVNSTTQKSLRGSECAPGCIWSTYAVSTGTQKLTHYCDGEGCHCVEIGNINNSCHEASNVNSVQEETNTSNWSSNTSTSINVEKGNRIADSAYYEASRRNTVGYCYNAVADAIEYVTGPFLWGGHAYQAADQLAASSHFFEVHNYTLTSLPSGAVVVWAKGSSRSGHISVSLGDGREASDHIAYQMTYHYGGGKSRVFYPR